MASLALVVGLALPAGGQIIHVPERSATRRPIHVSAEIGFLDSQGRYDGPSGTFWNLGAGVHYRASVGVGFRPGTLGLAGSISDLPVTRTGGGLGTLRGNVEMRSLLLVFRTPETDRLHQIIELGTGPAQWVNLRGTGGVISPEETDPRNSWAFVVSYGLGIPLGSRAAVTIQQDLNTLLDPKDDLPRGTSRVIRQYTTRLGFRLRAAGERR